MAATLTKSETMKKKMRKYLRVLGRTAVTATMEAKFGNHELSQQEITDALSAHHYMGALAHIPENERPAKLAIAFKGIGEASKNAVAAVFNSKMYRVINNLGEAVESNRTLLQSNAPKLTWGYVEKQEVPSEEFQAAQKVRSIVAQSRVKKLVAMITLAGAAVIATFDMAAIFLSFFSFFKGTASSEQTEIMSAVYCTVIIIGTLLSAHFALKKSPLGIICLAILSVASGVFRTIDIVGTSVTTAGLCIAIVTGIGIPATSLFSSMALTAALKRLEEANWLTKEARDLFQEKCKKMGENHERAARARAGNLAELLRYVGRGLVYLFIAVRLTGMTIFYYIMLWHCQWRAGRHAQTAETIDRLVLALCPDTSRPQQRITREGRK